MLLNKIRYIISLSVIVLFISCQSGNSLQQSFDLKKIADKNANSQLDSEVIKVVPTKDNTGIVIWEKGDSQNWAKGKYLVFEIIGDNEYSGKINIEFYKQNGNSKPHKVVLQSGEVTFEEEDTPWFSSLMGILPKLKTKVVFPLSYLDAQTLFVTRSPRQLKGTINGDRLDPNDIVKVVLRFGPYFEPYYIPTYSISSISITEEKSLPYPSIDEPIIDKFGQWKLKEWKGKLESEEELVKRGNDLKNEAVLISYPKDWSKYGGWKNKKFNATGYFRTHHDGNRWWLIDPDGYGFLSVGVDCIRKNSSGPVNGIEDLFDWLPTKNDSDFPVLTEGRNGDDYMDFYQANMIRVFGKEWPSDWENITSGLMKKFRFNTVGNWSDLDFAKNTKTPYVLPMQGFPSTKIKLYRDFPDVFADEYKLNSKQFAKQLNEYKDDPYLIGYFLRNEPHWAFGFHNLAYEMFGTDQQSVTKDEFIKWLAGKYENDISSLNKEWNLSLNHFDELKSMTLKEYPSKKADADFYAFSEVMVKQYIDIPCDEVEKVDENHLNLGMRYAWISSDLLYKAGERFDVFSINGYGINPPPTEEIAKKSRKPIMIGEFHHGATDRGLPATGIIGVLNQEDRGNAYRNYIEQGFARPELIGMHYFQWVDQPFYGRFDGENYNIGVVDITNQPYEELTKAMLETNQRIYKVGTGETKPFKKDIVEIPPIHY